MLFNLQFVHNIFSDYEGSLDRAKEIDSVTTDSRKEAGNSLFIPLCGERFDGHDYLQQAIENGAAAALWQKDKIIPAEYEGKIPLFLVEDTLEALQILARSYREKINPIVIGITGSNGKTTTKDLVKAVLARQFRTHATIGNYNNNIGMPLTILQMSPDTEMLILEMGMNHFGEIEELSQLASPDFAIITNIGESHIEYLGSRQGIAKAKLEILTGLKAAGTLIIDGDEPLLNNVKTDIELVTCGTSADNDLIIKDVTISESETDFSIDGYQYQIPLPGKHQAKNASYVIALARKLSVSNEDIQAGLGSLSHSGMRFERIEGRNGALLINDAYNASYTSMKAAIDVVKNLHKYRNKVLVLGDILELGSHSTYFHQQIAANINEPINAVFTFGETAKEITAVLHKEEPGVTAAHFTDKSELVKALEPYLTEDSVILFKASRMMKFEELAEACR